jgi:hypothetical protein
MSGAPRAAWAGEATLRKRRRQLGRGPGSTRACRRRCGAISRQCNNGAKLCRVDNELLTFDGIIRMLARRCLAPGVQPATKALFGLGEAQGWAPPRSRETSSPTPGSCEPFGCMTCSQTTLARQSASSSSEALSSTPPDLHRLLTSRTLPAILL